MRLGTSSSYPCHSSSRSRQRESVLPPALGGRRALRHHLLRVRVAASPLLSGVNLYENTRPVKCRASIPAIPHPGSFCPVGCWFWTGRRGRALSHRPFWRSPERAPVRPRVLFCGPGGKFRAWDSPERADPGPAAGQAGGSQGVRMGVSRAVRGFPPGSRRAHRPDRGRRAGRCGGFGRRAEGYGGRRRRRG